MDLSELDTPLTDDDLTLVVRNRNGKTFTVRLALPGDRYGTSPAPVIGRDPIVEFYDHDRIRPHEPHGQFTGGRYYLSTLLGRRPDTGLILIDSQPEWTVDADAMIEVVHWLQELTGGGARVAEHRQ